MRLRRRHRGLRRRGGAAASRKPRRPAPPPPPSRGAQPLLANNTRGAARVRGRARDFFFRLPAPPKPGKSRAPARQRPSSPSPQRRVSLPGTAARTSAAAPEFSARPVALNCSCMQPAVAGSSSFDGCAASLARAMSPAPRRCARAPRGRLRRRLRRSPRTSGAGAPAPAATLCGPPRDGSRCGVGCSGSAPTWNGVRPSGGGDGHKRTRQPLCRCVRAAVEAATTHVRQTLFFSPPPPDYARARWAPLARRPLANVSACASARALFAAFLRLRPPPNMALQDAATPRWDRALQPSLYAFESMRYQTRSRRSLPLGRRPPQVLVRDPAARAVPDRAVDRRS